MKRNSSSMFLLPRNNMLLADDTAKWSPSGLVT